MDMVTLQGIGVLAGEDTSKTVIDLKEEDVVVKVIETLRGHEDRSRWVQAGIPLHAELDTCLFCGGPLSDHRKQELADHFPDSLNRLQQKIDTILKTLDTSVTRSKSYLTAIPRDVDVYPELIADLQAARSAYKAALSSYELSVKALSAVLASKRDNPFQKPVLAKGFELVPPSATAVEEVVKQHEERHTSHKTRSEEAARRVELELVKSLITEYKELTSDIATKNKVVDDKEDEIQTLSQQIVSLQNVSADPVPAAEELTKNV